MRNTEQDLLIKMTNVWSGAVQTEIPDDTVVALRVHNENLPLKHLEIR